LNLGVEQGVGVNLDSLGGCRVAQAILEGLAVALVGKHWGVAVPAQLQVVDVPVRGQSS
jgi:hypothetical protein